MQVVALVDQVEVARYIAFKDKPETAAERKHKDAMKDQKAALIEALHQKCKCASAPPRPRSVITRMPCMHATAAAISCGVLGRVCACWRPFIPSGPVRSRRCIAEAAHRVRLCDSMLCMLVPARASL